MSRNEPFDVWGKLSGSWCRGTLTSWSHIWGPQHIPRQRTEEAQTRDTVEDINHMTGSLETTTEQYSLSQKTKKKKKNISICLERSKIEFSLKTRSGEILW